MFDTPSKRVREHVARAKAALTKGDLVKSVHFAYEAMNTLVGGNIFGRDKFECEVHIQEYLKEFNSHSDIKDHFSAQGIHVTPFIRYERGQEKKVLLFFKGMNEELSKAEQQQEQEQEAKKEERKQELLDKGQQFLDDKDFPKAKVYLKRCAEAYGDEPGVLTDVGARLLKAGLYFEAGEILEQAIDVNPKDSKALAHAVQAYKNAREFPKVEKLYKIALATFGMHPKTLLHMAEMYHEWHKWDDAYNYAKQAYDMDSSLDKAKAIMDETGKRIFG